jgi:hypothetical protein
VFGCTDDDDNDERISKLFVVPMLCPGCFNHVLWWDSARQVAVGFVAVLSLFSVGVQVLFAVTELPTLSLHRLSSQIACASIA